MYESWLFLTIREIFSLKVGIKAICPCFCMTSNINVHRRIDVALAPIPAAGSTRKTASKKTKER